MVEKISKEIAKGLVRREVIEYEDYEIYEFGVEQLITNIIDLLTLLIVGLVTGMVCQGLIFAFSFMVIRKYAGGYHASTMLRCFFLTNFMLVIVILLMKFVEINRFMCLGIILMSGAIIGLLSPVQTKNKPLDGIEKLIYRKKTLITLVVETTVAVICTLLNKGEISACIMMAQVVLTFSLIAGSMKEKQ